MKAIKDVESMAPEAFALRLANGGKESANEERMKENIEKTKKERHAMKKALSQVQRMRVCMYVCLYKCLYVSLYVCLYVCLLYARMYACIFDIFLVVCGYVRDFRVGSVLCVCMCGRGHYIYVCMYARKRSL